MKKSMFVSPTECVGNVPSENVCFQYNVYDEISLFFILDFGELIEYGLYCPTKFVF